MLSELSAEDLAVLNAMSADELAPPPSQEDIFGKMDILKSQFAEDNEKIERQMKENQVCMHSQVS